MCNLNALTDVKNKKNKLKFDVNGLSLIYLILISIMLQSGNLKKQRTKKPTILSLWDKEILLDSLLKDSVICNSHVK